MLNANEVTAVNWDDDPTQLYIGPDEAFSRLASRCLEVISSEKLEELMQGYSKFNEPIYIRGLSSYHKDDNFKLKAFFRVIPEYFASALQVGLSQDQAQKLILTVLEASPYVLINQRKHFY